MSRPTERLEAELMALPPTDRARLARRLIASLDEGIDDDPEVVAREWEREIERRLKEYHAGEVEAIPASTVIAEARARLRRD